MARDAISVVPPGAAVTIILRGLDGNTSAAWQNVVKAARLMRMLANVFKLA